MNDCTAKPLLKPSRNNRDIDTLGVRYGKCIFEDVSALYIVLCHSTMCHAWSGEVVGVADNLRELLKDLFLSSCCTKKDEDEDEETVRQESELWFDYIYEHEEISLVNTIFLRSAKQ